MSAARTRELLLTLDLHVGHIKRCAGPRSGDRHGSHGIRILVQGLSDFEFHVFNRVKDTKTILVKDDTGCAVVMALVLLAFVFGFGFGVGVHLAGDKGSCRVDEGGKGVLAGLDACVSDGGSKGLVA